MKVIITNKELEHLFLNRKEKGSPKYPPEVSKAFIKKVRIIQTVDNTQQLRQFKSLHLEQLKGDYEGQHSVRVNDKYRIILRIVKEENGTTYIEVVKIDELVDYHW